MANLETFEIKEKLDTNRRLLAAANKRLRALLLVANVTDPVDLNESGEDQS